MKDKLKKIFNISDKTILITGASGFFGRYIVKTFLDVDANVILLSRSQRILDQIKQYQKEYGKNRVFGFRQDFYNRKKLENILHQIAQDFDIDVVINNAYDLSEKTGFNTPSGTLEKSTYDQWRSAFESGIYWAVTTTQIIGKKFITKKKGSIINISSMYGLISPNPKLYTGTKFFNPPTYSVSKSAMIGLTRYTASFYGEYGIRCNAILPGPFSNIESKGPNSVDPNDPFLEKLRKNTVLSRLGHPQDLKGILIYLACDASSYMTGQMLIVDGGWTII